MNREPTHHPRPDACGTGPDLSLVPPRPGVRILGLHALDVAAVTVIALSAAFRIVLILQGWPPLNSDEATNALMALHIAHHGELPIFVYGQAYVGAIEAYVAAALFLLFGVSDVALRLGVVLFCSLFLGALYLLARLLYDRRVGLVSVIILGLGDPEMLSRQLEASGGYMEMLVFATVALLLASWLVLSDSQRGSGRRYAAYGGVGLMCGLGFWSHFIILSLLLAPALLLLFFRRDELRTRASLCLLAGLLVGLLPVILNDLASFPHQTTIGTLLALYGAGGTGATHVQAPLAQRLAGALAVGFPLFTGGQPVCTLPPQAPWPLPPHPGAHTILCTAVHGMWSGGFAAVWLLAAAGAVAALRRWRGAGLHTAGGRSVRALSGCRLAVLGAAGLTTFLYMMSPAPAISPRPSARYLIDLWIAVPCLVAVLLTSSRGGRWTTVRTVGKMGILAGLLAVMTLGTIDVIHQIPYMQWQSWEQNALIGHLEEIGATRIYTDYWTCYRTIYQSRERILCAVLDEHLRPSENRYPAYRDIVVRDARAAYVFPNQTPFARAMAQHVAQSRQRFRRYVFNFYVVYQPVSAMPERSR